jgi:single-strand DNA-binding protein
MAKGVNKTIILGNLGDDPKITFTPGGACVALLSVATSEMWKDKATGQPQERTEWHRIVFYERIAEVLRDYAKKGHKVYVEGQLRTRKWQAQDGSDRYTTEIVGRELQLLTPQEQNPQQQQQNQQRQQQRGAPGNSMMQQPAPQPQQGAQQHYGYDQPTDDIPY